MRCQYTYIEIEEQSDATVPSLKIYLNEFDIYVNKYLNGAPNVNYKSFPKCVSTMKEKWRLPRTKLSLGKHTKCQWITRGIIRSSDIGNKMYKQLRLTSCESNDYTGLKVNNNKYKAAIITLHCKINYI